MRSDPETTPSDFKEASVGKCYICGYTDKHPAYPPCDWGPFLPQICGPCHYALEVLDEWLHTGRHDRMRALVREARRQARHHAATGGYQQ